MCRLNLPRVVAVLCCSSVLYGAHTIVQSNTIMYLLPCMSIVFKLQYINLSGPNAAVYLTMLQMPPKKQGSCLVEQRVSLFLKNP